MVEELDKHIISEDPKVSKKKRKFRRRSIIIALAVIVAAAVCGVAVWRLFVWQPAVVNPFSAKILASAQFPLYYPTSLPKGFRIDTNSVTEPQQGVVVFNLVGSKNEKVYVSEEARPSKFDLGGFYNQFADLKEVGVSDGAIAVGYINHNQTEVASRANNKAWVLCNTNARIPLEQLITMLKSLTYSY